METAGERNLRAVGGRRVLLTLSLLGLVGGASGCSSPPSRLERSSFLVDGEFGVVPDQYTFQLFIVDTQAGCTVAQTAKVTINDVSYPMEGDCSIRDVPAGNGGPITIRAQDGEDTAEVMVSGLFPGMQATFVSPANAIATPGSDVVIAVPPALQNRPAGFLNIAVLAGGDPARSNQLVMLQGTVADQVHFMAPAGVGGYSVSIGLYSSLPDYSVGLDLSVPVTTCHGFKECGATGAAFLGPLSLQVRSAP